MYEAPAAVVLHAAHRELQEFVTPRDLERLTSELGVKYADLVYNGLWFTPTREAIDALVQNVQETGHRHHPDALLQGRVPRHRAPVARLRTSAPRTHRRKSTRSPRELAT